MVFKLFFYNEKFIFMDKGSTPIGLIHPIMLEVNGFEKWITLPCLEVVGIQVVAKNMKETGRRVLTAIQMGGLWSTDKHIQTLVILKCVHDIIVKKIYVLFGLQTFELHDQRDQWS